MADSPGFAAPTPTATMTRGGGNSSTTLPLRIPPPSPPPPGSSSPTSAYVKPQPRPPRSPAHSARIRVQNRRREYLERNPGYFDSLEHELADPLLYDALIRHFQTPAEREEEARAKGYSRVLEVDLMRGEAKLAQLTSSLTCASISLPAPQAQVQIQDETAPSPWIPPPAAADADVFIREYASGYDEYEVKTGEPGPENAVAAVATGPETREEGRARWDDFLRRRFVLGRDEDFDYRGVDEDDTLDALERRELEDAWFDEEDPGWASSSSGGDDDGGGGGGDDEKRRRKKEKELEGETGIQDF
ncbi:hypothetical protein AAE478_008854 [Parahypoxylon ruwenzoriense]